MNKTGTRRFLAWPGWEHLRFAWVRTALITFWFTLVFVGADWITLHRDTRVRVHFEAELKIPLIPGFTLIYMSIYLQFIAAPFVLRTRREISTLVRALAVTIGLAGIGFILIPARLAYSFPDTSQLGIWLNLFHFADQLNLDYNLVPSLHVALSVVCLELFATHANRIGVWLLRGWATLIAISTVLTHQHHLVDAVAGYVLALAVVALVSRRINPQPPASNFSTNPQEHST